VVITCLHQAHQTPQYLLSGGEDGIVSFIAFMYIVRDLFNDEFISTYMDLTYA